MIREAYNTRSRKQRDLPPDMKTEILLKLPPKYVAGFASVSRQWSSMIRDKGFIKLYLNRSSSTRPRLLFTVCGREKQFFHSCSQEDPSSDHHRVSITRNTDHSYKFSPPVRGLICCQNDSRVLIGNPSSGQFVTLPRVKTWRKGIFSFFGYDPINDVYKVLCMTVINAPPSRESQVVSEQHQVFALGAKKPSWRMIKCNHPHVPTPHSKGLCMDGVIYYYARIRNQGSLISFDLRCEEFDVIELPEAVQLLESCELVSYCGKIALTNELRCDGELDLWVLEDASREEWLKVSILVPRWRDLAGYHTLWFKGAVSAGELIFAPYFATMPPSFFILCYDPRDNSAKKVVIDGIGDQYPDVEVFLNHTETPAFLTNLRKLII